MDQIEQFSIIQKIMAENAQDHITRVPLYAKIEEILKRPLLTYFTSLVYPVMIDDSDVDMIGGLLQGMDLSHGLVLMVSTHGGDGLAAERIIRTCKSFSGTHDFWVIVPGKAKSAGTMICFGAAKIIMTPSSELGPIDPQIMHRNVNGDEFPVSAISEVNTYQDLFKRAVSETGRLEPYLQQLSNYDATKIASYVTAIELSKDIAIKALTQGMMNGKTPEEISASIELFLSPEATKTHGRPIFYEEAEKCGLNIEQLELTSELGASVYELYVRLKMFSESRAVKVVESTNSSVHVPLQVRS